ncbi:hypothetical protein [Streptacidiphilus carbonis]|uniref:hypothetical protein n=1 Tax=Streptacidiphilus carbonis TaxID=105422 RepID=UPI0005A9513C|nr:hypothetical protein [Streptacidiphilus carbonis]
MLPTWSELSPEARAEVEPLIGDTTVARFGLYHARQSAIGQWARQSQDRTARIMRGTPSAADRPAV